MDSSDLPQDYSLSCSETHIKSEDNDECDSNKNINSHNNNNNNNNLLSKSMKLNFGVERILLKNDENNKLSISKSNTVKIKDNEKIKVFSDNNKVENNNSELNLLHQQLIYSDINGLTNQNYILKPFPIRYVRNDKGCTQQPPNYFQFNLKKNLANCSNPIYTAMDSCNQFLRQPPLPQLSLSNNNALEYFNQKTARPPTDSSSSSSASCGNSKRKRSWSRAVFSNLQRKGLERQFEFQKYITKPDRKKLAARLGLKDSQVKVWFQNRRMKWRHSTNRGAVFNDNNKLSSFPEQNDDQFTSSDEEDAEIDVVTDR